MRPPCASQAEDRVPEDRMVADPPLLRLETEASHAFLSVIMHLHSLAARPAVREEVGTGDRLVKLCLDVLRRCVCGGGGG